MKKIVVAILIALMGTVGYAQEQGQTLQLGSGQAKIKFDKVKHNFGTFYDSSPKVSCVFHFTNEGDGLLVIHQAISSCGCTVPDFPMEPIKPGDGGDITVTYDGTGRFPGRFKKTVSIRTNSKNELVRLTIEGNMEPAAAEPK